MNQEDYKELRKSAMPLKASDLYASLHTFFDLCFLTLAILLSCRESTAIWLLGQLLLVIGIWRSFSILHSCVHHSFFRKRHFNDKVGTFFSIFALTPYQSWKNSHLKHHQHPRHRKLDPSLCLPKVEQVSDRTKKVLDFCWRFHIPVFSFLVTFLKKQSFESKKVKDYSGYILLTGQLALMLSLRENYLKVFALPIFLYLFTSDFVIISQHNLFGQVKDEDLENLGLKDHGLVTRTMRLPKLIGRFVFLNFDLHTLHHHLPQVPHYHLRELDSDKIPKEEFFPWLKKVSKVPGHRVYLD